MDAGTNAGRLICRGVIVKVDAYLSALEMVTARAQTKWDIDKMRAALIVARANLERRAESAARDAFRLKAGGL